MQIDRFRFDGRAWSVPNLDLGRSLITGASSSADDPGPSREPTSVCPNSHGSTPLTLTVVAAQV
jgi:hypothetical protein